MLKKRVVVVGGGFAGIKIALELSNDKNFEVTIISPREIFEYHGAMYRSATGRSPLEAVVPLTEIFSNSQNVRVELDSVVAIRPATKEIVCETGQAHRYDYLVVTVGCVVNYFGIPGMAEYSENLYTIAGAIELRHRLVDTFRETKPGVPVHIAVIGGGPTGVEVASDIRNFSMLVAGKYGLDDLAVKTTLVESAPRILRAFTEKSSVLAEERLQHLGVRVLTHAQVLKASKKSVTTNTQVIPADIIIWTAGNRANPLLGQYPDLFTLDARQRVIVSDYFQANAPDVFVLGDAASTPYAGMAQTAIHNAIWLAANLKRAANGQALQAYIPQQPEYVVPVGGEWALLQTATGVISGTEAWQKRREADKWALENFLVYSLAREHWLKGDTLGQF